MDRKEATGLRIQDQYPLIIAGSYRKLEQLQFEKPSTRLKQAIELWEAALRYLATIVCRTYLVNDGGSDEINRLIEGFKRPSTGHWVRLLRECAGRYVRKRGTSRGEEDAVPADAGPAALCSEIARYYFSPFPGKRRHEAFRTAEHLRDRLIGREEVPVKTLQPTNAGLFDLMTHVRNWMAHTARRTEQEYADVLDHLIPLLNHILEGLAFLVDYPLYYVREVRVEKGAFEHSMERCMGRDFEVERLILSGAPLNNDELYLFEMTYLPEQEPSVLWALSLSPYLIVEQCRECHHPQVFVFNKMEQKRLEFVSYQCVSPPVHTGPMCGGEPSDPTLLSI